MFPGMMLWHSAHGQGSGYQLRLNGNTAVEGAWKIGTSHKYVPDKCLKLVFTRSGRVVWVLTTLNVFFLCSMHSCGKYNRLPLNRFLLVSEFP